MSEILKAGWLELQLVTDVLGMSPLAGNKKQVFPLLYSPSWSHTPPRPSSHKCKSNPKTCCILPNMSKMFPTTMGILLIWTNLVNLSFTWSRNFPLSLLWCHNYIIHLILLVVKEISYLTKHILVKLWHWSSMHPTHMQNRAKPEPLTSPH